MSIRAYVTATGRTHQGPEFYNAPAPEFRLTGPLPPCSGYFAEGDVVALPDGASAYACPEYDGSIGLYRSIVAEDYGGNETSRRTAPSSVKGIAAGRGVARTRGDGIVGYLSADSYEIAYGRA